MCVLLLNETAAGSDPAPDAPNRIVRSGRSGAHRHLQSGLVQIAKAYVFASTFLVLLGSTVTAEAGVWEFDRKGRVLVAPASPENVPYNKPYVANAIISTRSTRNPSSPATGHAAIYRPMAEGVARVFARDPAIARAGLDAEEFSRLFVALIDQESRFNPDAISPKGARGLGQLMPQTAAALGVRDALEPMENLRGAARYLTAQIATFGRVDLALAAYNAGPHRVTQYQGIPPFRETQDYVARITQAAALEPPPLAVSPPEASRAPEAPRVPALELVSDTVPLSTPTPPKESVLEWKN